ncbi:conserved hypothetical protein [Neospora caninum Liverpool]|uniref:Uncharacterized protein n=1 Tax=Neospora caninum (strain Liverpool) TaxID=572307 RepID=F0VGJ1_NEOCL|nr:conserved hypothetical protein [Neospora caninum Liverpool]CBZ52835.1 conserved hypothetical protein [Neospora caninum Liverpool]CEL66815.1 TPA: hypothetical protein BN1204_026240 [Neospora caninum Liverpool]|eukprot:XP_003882867.1 conserved hypothetical protein [Neospora caninum Liverpool]
MRIDKIVLLVAPVGLALSSLVFSPAIQGTPNARFPPLVDATGAPSFTSQEDNLTPLQLSLDLFKPIHTKGNGPSTLFGVQAPSSASDSAAAPTDAHTDFEASQELNADDGAPGRTPLPRTLVLHMMDTLWVLLPRMGMAASSLTMSSARPLTSSEAREWAEADEDTRVTLLQKWREGQSDSSRRAAWLKYRKFMLSKNRPPTRYRPEPEVMALLQKELIFRSN